MALSRANFPERMQLCRPWCPKKAVPGVGSKPHDAGKSPLEITKLHGAYQRCEVSAERAQGGPMLRARVERRDQEDRGTSKRRGHCLRDERQSTRRFGRAHRN